MTDEEILKALECCGVNRDCAGCPKEKEPYGCYFVLCGGALDLINRQKAETERLNVELVGMRGACESYKMHYDNAQAEIERLQKENIILSHNADTAFQDGLNEAQELYQEQIKSEIKRQAINDFVETFEERCISGGIYPAFIKNQLYAVKGDMTEGDKL